MTATITTVADAVVDTLNNATFDDPHPAVFAERRYRFDTQLKELGDRVHVRVYQSSQKAVNINIQYEKQRDLLIDIAIQRRTPLTDNEDGDAMMGLLQQIETLFLGKALTNVTGCFCVAADWEKSEAQIQTAETFAWLLSLTFRVVG